MEKHKDLDACFAFCSLRSPGCVCVATEGLSGRDKQALPGCVHDFSATYFLFLQYFHSLYFFLLLFNLFNSNFNFVGNVVLQISSGESVTMTFYSFLCVQQLTKKQTKQKKSDLKRPK